MREEVEEEKKPLSQRDGRGSINDLPADASVPLNVYSATFHFLVANGKREISLTNE